MIREPPKKPQKKTQKNMPLKKTPFCLKGVLSFYWAGEKGIMSFLGGGGAERGELEKSGNGGGLNQKNV